MGDQTVKTEDQTIKTEDLKVKTESHIIAEDNGKRLVEKEIDVINEDHKEMEITNEDLTEVKTRWTFRPRRNLNQRPELTGNRKRPLNDNLRQNVKRTRSHQNRS